MSTCPICLTHFSDDLRVCPHDGALLVADQVSSEPFLASGQMVGEYQIEARIGDGGFGTVYSAVHPVIGKRAAVKVLSRACSSNPEIVTRFIAEARSVNQIRHRNIVDIFAFGTLPDGRQFFVMELLDGSSLGAYLREHGAMSIVEALPILRAIARAVDAAHAAGIAHRDLKPENVFLVPDDDAGHSPKLLDFGIAKLLGEGRGLHKTRTGTPIGTPQYMSPEQCHGKNVDHRTDIYSFGVMIFYMLTGRLPFEHDEVLQLLIAHTQAPAPRPSQLQPSFPSVLDLPILAMLEKEPSKRPKSLCSAVDGIAKAAVDAGLVDPSFRSVPVAPSPRKLAGIPVGSKPIGPESMAALVSARTLESANSSFSAKPHVLKNKLKSNLAVLLGLLLVVSAASAGFLVFRPRQKTASPPLASATFADISSTPAARSLPIGLSAAPSTSVSVAPTDRVQISVQATPTFADVFLGEEKLGQAPGPFVLNRGDKALKLRVQAKGYRSVDIDFTPLADGVLAVSLDKQVGSSKAVDAKNRTPAALEQPKW